MRQAVVTVLLVPILAGGCYRSWARVADGESPDSDAAPPPTCGNGVVDPPLEECDGNSTTCVGTDSCPGAMECGPACTWLACTSPGFGVISGPVDVNVPVPLDSVTRTSVSWTGSSQGVFFSATSDSEPGTPWLAWFAPLDADGGALGYGHRVMPETWPVMDIRACWREATGRFGLAMLTDPDAAQVIANVADPDGWVIIDPGIAIGHASPTGSMDVAPGASDRFPVAYVGPDGMRVAFLYESIEMTNLLLSPSSPDLKPSLPSLVTTTAGTTALWQVDDPSSGESWLEAVLPPLSSVAEHIKLFEDEDARPPSAIAAGATSLAILFGTQPYYDSAYVDVHLAILDPSTGDAAITASAGMARRAANHDAAIASGAPSWSDPEYGAALASPSSEAIGAPRILTFIRFSEGGAQMGGPIAVTSSGDSSLPAISWDGEAWGVLFAHEEEGGGPAVEFARVGCLAP